MGAFYNSICVPGDHREEVRLALVRWLSFKGFELREGPVLFDLDGEQERSVFLFSSTEWTVFFYSHYDEELRLLRELRSLAEPVLYVWVYDSDVWGWDLFGEDGFTGSYCSDPRTHQSFAEEPVGSSARPRAGAETLCRVLGMGEQLQELRRIERLRLPFKEDVCRQFCRELGAEVAASSYDDLESGALGEPEWQGQQLLFALRDLKTGSAEIDLHSSDLKRLQPALAYAPSETVELPTEILVEMKRMRRRIRTTHRLLRPVSWLARTWRGVREALAGRMASEAAAPTTRRTETRENVRIRSAVLVNERHRCQITLAEGVTKTTVSTKPSAVFAFVAGEATVTCTARRLSKIDEVLRKPSRSKVLADENYIVGGVPARHLVFELPPSFVAGSQDPSYLAIYVIQTYKALYVFLYRSGKPLLEAEASAIRDTVDTFRFLPAPEASSEGRDAR